MTMYTVQATIGMLLNKGIHVANNESRFTIETAVLLIQQ